MPTVLRQDGFQVMIFTHDHLPAHVRIKKGGGLIIVEIESGSVRGGYGLTLAEANKAKDLVEANRAFLLAEWERIGPIP